MKIGDRVSVQVSFYDPTMRDEVMGEAELPAVMKNFGVKVEEANHDK